MGVTTIFYKSEIKNSFFQHVELVELITNHPTCNYPSCNVTEIIESLFSLFSLCIGFFYGMGQKIVIKSKIKNYFFENVELVELITNNPTCIFKSNNVTEIFESLFSLFSLFSLCIGFFYGGGHKNCS